MTKIKRLAETQELLHRQPQLFERLAETQELLHRQPQLFERLAETQELLHRQPQLFERLAETQELLHRQPQLFERLAETQELLHRRAELIARLSGTLLEDPRQNASLNPETQELLRRQSELTGRLPTETESLLEATRGIERRQELIRTAFGPLEDLRRIDLELASTAMPDVERLRPLGVFESIEKQFRLPRAAETATLLQKFESGGVGTATRRELEIQRAMGAMRSPWLDIENRIQSVTGFVRLQDLGHSLQTMPPFDMTLADRLRPALGDWREPVDWPEDIIADPLERADFYAARGFDPTLTAFPAAAFDESIIIAGLKKPLPNLRETDDSEREAEVDEEEAGFRRTNAAHDRLQRFESKMRKFISRRMQAAFGEDWIKHQVPGPIHQAWLDKQRKARDNGEPERLLIDYADFTDYVPIIIRKDNWQAVFQPVFNRKELVRESFQRLYPIRRSVMHSCIIIQDDELYLHAETKRLLKAIKTR